VECLGVVEEIFDFDHRDVGCFEREWDGETTDIEVENQPPSHHRHFSVKAGDVLLARGDHYGQEELDDFFRIR